MEEKAAEGNLAYFAEYAAEEFEPKLAKYRDEDGRTLLHTAAAAGASSRAFRFAAFPQIRGAKPALTFPSPYFLRAQASSISSSSSSPPMPAEGW